MSLDRYACQVRLARVGAAGQRRLAEATAVVVGVGATGSVIAESLARAGVGRLRLVDRDVLELSNLARQTLYDEADVAEALPKAEAARRRLARVNGAVALEARVADVEARTVRGLLEGADVVLDGTDNFLTRFVLNDACLAQGTPWVYAGVVGTTVHGFPVVPGATPCFRCYLEAPPPPGAVETCETAGVLGAAVQVCGGLAAAEGIKLLLGQGDQAATGLLTLDVWTRDSRRLGLTRWPDCPACAGRYEFLEGSAATAELCGQDAVAVRAPRPDARVDLAAVAARLEPLGRIEARNAFLIRFAPREPADVVVTLFCDGRALVKGTRDPAFARTVVARFVGG